jgi:hypothetical protein
MTGSELVARVEKFVGDYIVFDDADLPLVVALWAIGSYVTERIYTWPYLAITASVKGAGKTTLLEVLRELVRHPVMTTGSTPPFILRTISKTSGQCCLLFDEAESQTSSEGQSLMSQLMNSGYRRGQTIGRAKGADDVVEYPSYCAKAFALIGDPRGTIRDRAIVITLRRGRPKLEMYPEDVEPAANEIRQAIATWIAGQEMAPRPSRPDALDGRSREIWGSVLGLAEWLRCSPDQMSRLGRAAGRIEGAKTAPKRSALSVEAEDAAIDDRYARRALLDLLAVFDDGEAALSTEGAIARMMRLEMSQWQTFRGTGLDGVRLGQLLGRFGLRPSGVRAADLPKGADRRHPNKSGYTRAAVLAAAKAAM